MRTYYAVLRLRLLNGLQYRGAAFAGVATQFCWGSIYIMIYEAFYSHAGSPPPMTLKELVAYIWLQQALLALIVLWFRDNDLFDLIAKGNIAYELCRPFDMYSFWFSKLIAQRLSAAFLRSLPILFIAFLIPKPYRMSLPLSFLSFIVFVVTLLLAVILLVAISMFMYLSVFITMSPTGSLLMFNLIGEFFAGLVVPIPLMPNGLQRLANVLPFRYTMDFPFRVYSGQIPVEQALYGILIQLAWLILLVGFGRVTLNKVLAKVVVQGG
ncbi:ABC transporter permease [Pullulanibacillus sp. KACC 23026]|uniref:ABC transporter permease n=1 Tax=Pullulanibacillus sp. KACC 23026 TaxID=3028315 RepID=UPI0023B13ED6|nr:ABC transporter permease [Pullulanibacillus sp. KACC 23026]WEG12185.1 ABC transporter permease [Pullulanibacillus sp. KACC 23026]